MPGLTSRERVLAAVNRSPADRPPVGSMGFAEGVARDIRRLLGASDFGTISTQTTLPNGTPDDVRCEVRERIRVLGDCGGYIVSPDHQVMDDVPAENAIALYETVGSLAG